MIVRYIKSAAGIEQGFVKSLPDALADTMIRMGICEAVKTPEISPVKAKDNKIINPVAKPAKKGGKRAKKATI